jgi:hypothetical protein
VQSVMRLIFQTPSGVTVELPVHINKLSFQRNSGRKVYHPEIVRITNH